MNSRAAAVTIFVSFLAVASAAQELTIQPSFPGDRWIAARDRVQLRLSRPLEPGEGTLAVFFGTTDVTALFEAGPGALTYRPNTLPLPAGEQEVVVYAIPAEGAWREVGRYPIKVLTTRGFRKAAVKPSLDLTNKGQIDQFQDPADTSSRDRFQDLTLQGGLSGDLERENFVVRTRMNVAGASFIREALRFGEKGDNAPRVDLSNYVIELQRGITGFSLGHVAFGTQRHLINSFGSRGATLTFGVGKPVSLQLAAMNGTSIVGWDNIVGVTNRQHRMFAVTLGFELMPSRQGALRLEASVLDGSLLPFDAYTQGSIRSAEKSRGEALRVLASTPSQRFIIDAGFARSRFQAQRDEELEGGLNVVPLTEKDRGAGFLDATVVLLQNRKLGATQTASVSLTLNLERVEPLYRSVAVSTQADLQRGALTLSGNVGPLTVQVGHIRMEDNLEGLRTILKTKTEQSTVNLGLSLASLFGARRGVRWIPMLTSTINHTHQYGAFLPINSGFSDSHVPDQISLNAQAGLEWQVQPVRFGFRTSLVDQDNRQIGRERSDFKSGSGTAFFALQPSDRVEISLESTRENQRNIEFAQRDKTTRNGVTLSWRFFRDLAIAGNYSRTNGDNDPLTAERSSSEKFVELSSGFKMFNSQQNRNRIFARYSNRGASNFDRVFNTRSANEGWTLTSGLSLSLF
jgi:hypothetical protein